MTAAEVISPKETKAARAWRLLTTMPSSPGQHDHAALDEGVVEGVPLDQRVDEQARRVHPEQPQQRAVATLPNLLGERASLRQRASQARQYASLTAFLGHRPTPSAAGGPRL